MTPVPCLCAACREPPLLFVRSVAEAAAVVAAVADLPPRALRNPHAPTVAADPVAERVRPMLIGRTENLSSDDAADEATRLREPMARVRRALERFEATIAPGGAR